MTEEKIEIPDTLTEVKSKDSLVKKYITPEMYAKHAKHRTKTTGQSLYQCIRCAVLKDDQHVGIYAADEDCYIDFKDLFDPIIEDYHQIKEKREEAKKNNVPLHQSDLDVTKITETISDDVPVVSTRIRVGRNIKGYGLSPGITKEQRIAVEKLMIECFKSLEGDLSGDYYPLTGMKPEIQEQLTKDHFLFKSGDENLKFGGMERDWPEGRGIFHNKDKTFLVWVGEEDQLRIISMGTGSDVRAVFDRLVRGINSIEKILKSKGKEFQYNGDYGFFHSCPTNLGTGMRASVHIDLPKWNKEKDNLKSRCKELHMQARGAHGESTKDDSGRFDLSNRYRLGYSEVQLVQMMINGVNTIWKEECEKN